MEKKVNDTKSNDWYQKGQLDDCDITRDAAIARRHVGQSSTSLTMLEVVSMWIVGIGDLGMFGRYT